MGRGRTPTDEQIKVVNVSLDVPDTPELKKAVRGGRCGGRGPGRRQRQPAAGRTPTPTTTTSAAVERRRRGGRGDGDPSRAAYPDVLAVNATPTGYRRAPDPVDLARLRAEELPDRRRGADVRRGVARTSTAAPACSSSVATSWATAEVSGVVAMLRSWYADDSAQQIIARLKATADGTDAEPRSRLTGAGVVQPLEALMRPLTPTESGTVVAARRGRASSRGRIAPRPEGDPLGSMRDNAVWWGLLSGGASCWRC